MSGTASSGVLVIAQIPQTVMITVLVNTRNRFDAHQSMIRSIIDVYSARRARPDLRGGDGDFLLSDLLAVLPDADRRVPFPGHHDVAGTRVLPASGWFQLLVIPHLTHHHWQ